MSMHQVHPISGLLHLPELPYGKRDSVAAAEKAEKAAHAKARKLKPSKPAKPAVPARACLYASTGCDLRASGKCDSLHCSIAYEYEAQLAGGGQ